MSYRPIGGDHGRHCDDETWMPIPHTDGCYEISSCGRVRRDGVRILSTKPSGTSRYPVVTLSVRGARTRLVVHICVAQVFIGPRQDGLQVAHWDGDPINGHATNLRYATASDNNMDKLRHGTDHNRRKTHCPKGHAYTIDNLLGGNTRHRKCKACHRERMRSAT